MSKRAARREIILSEISELYNQGLSDPQIALALTYSDSTIQRYRVKYLQLPAHNPEIDYPTEDDRIKGYMIRNIKFSGKRRGVPFDLTYEDIELNNYCPLLNIPLVYRNQKGHFNDFNRATIDRIDNTKGYIKGNVWVISRLANNMKNEASLDQLELFSKKMLEFIENQRARGSITDSKSLDS